ncbi:MAG: Histone chaperone asf1 [Watsoniomyces obsoletus]|nr:MAG: Histone chaperone asf1 [Watsoniomyces obsoletus]
MATPAHCVFCFEVLAASLDQRESISLARAQDLWEQYEDENNNKAMEVDEAVVDDQEDENQQDDEEEGGQLQQQQQPTRGPLARLRPNRFSSSRSPSQHHHLSVPSPSNSSSSVSTPSSTSTTSSSSSSRTPISTVASSNSSRSSLFSPSSSSSAAATAAATAAAGGRRASTRPSPRRPEPDRPLFVTWNAISRNGHKSLRGCIGTFEAQPLEEGLKNYALTSSVSLFFNISSSMDCSNLKENFESAPTPTSWTLGRHGLRITFSLHGRRYGATYLPDVPVEQGWSKEETLISLMRKAGWGGRRDDWRKVGDLRVVRYQGKKVAMKFDEWMTWRRWVDKKRMEGMVE